MLIVGELIIAGRKAILWEIIELDENNGERLNQSHIQKCGIKKTRR